MELPSVGVKVFPSPKSREIRKSHSFIHYNPPPDPPIDYTLRDKPKKRPDYKVITDPFKKTPSPDFSQEEELLRNPPKLAVKKKSTRRSTQVIHNVLTESKHPPSGSRLIKRRDTLRESEMVLDDLDSTLEHEENISFRDAKNKIKSMNLPIRQYAPSASPLPDYNDVKVVRSASTAASSSARARTMAQRGQRAEVAPVLNETIIEDLRSMSDGQDISSINRHRKGMVEDEFFKTQKLISDARNTYTVDFFLKKNAQSDIPEWKRLLLAKRAVKTKLTSFEEKAWEDFNVWKKKYAPNVQLSAEYHYAMQPTLR